MITIITNPGNFAASPPECREPSGDLDRFHAHLKFGYAQSHLSSSRLSVKGTITRSGRKALMLDQIPLFIGFRKS